jgi:hypothetical protein
MITTFALLWNCAIEIVSVLEECTATIDLGVPARRTNKPVCRTDPLRHSARILDRPPPQNCARYDILLWGLDHDRVKQRLLAVGKHGAQAIFRFY